MLDSILKLLGEYAVQLIFSVLGILITAYVVPYLKKKNVYWIVEKLVEAAEKLKETNPELVKKDWVLSQLEAKGIKTDAFTEALIESAVKQLDIAVSGAAGKTEG